MKPSKSNLRVLYVQPGKRSTPFPQEATYDYSIDPVAANYGMWPYGIPDDIEIMQKTIEGYVEKIQIAPNVAILCDEDGKLKKLEPNFYLRYPGKRSDHFDTIVGPVIFIGTEGDKFVSLTKEQVKRLINILFTFRGFSVQTVKF